MVWCDWWIHSLQVAVFRHDVSVTCICDRCDHMLVHHIHSVHIRHRDMMRVHMHLCSRGIHHLQSYGIHAYIHISILTYTYIHIIHRTYIHTSIHPYEHIEAASFHTCYMFIHVVQCTLLPHSNRVIHLCICIHIHIPTHTHSYLWRRIHRVRMWIIESWSMS